MFHLILFIEIGYKKLIQFKNSIMNLKKLFSLVYNNESAIKFFQEHKILPEVKLCSNGHEMKLQIGNEKCPRWRCKSRRCRLDYDIRKDTWLQGSKIPLDTIIHFIYSWSKDYTSVKFCDIELNISKNTVVDFNNYMREVCVWKIEKESATIGGDGKIVEIDESLFVRRKYNVGRKTHQQWVFGGICRETDECFLTTVDDRSKETLIPLICKYIKPGSIIMSDCWKAYLNLIEHGYSHRHQTVNHKYNFVDPNSGANTQKVERMWGSAKWKNKKMRGTHRHHLPTYLSEFMWRQKNRHKNAFEEILKDIAGFQLDLNCNI